MSSSSSPTRATQTFLRRLCLSSGLPLNRRWLGGVCQSTTYLGSPRMCFEGGESPDQQPCSEVRLRSEGSHSGYPRPLETVCVPCCLALGWPNLVPHTGLGIWSQGSFLRLTFIVYLMWVSLRITTSWEANKAIPNSMFARHACRPLPRHRHCRRIYRPHSWPPLNSVQSSSRTGRRWSVSTERAWASEEQVANSSRQLSLCNPWHAQWVAMALADISCSMVL